MAFTLTVPGHRRAAIYADTGCEYAPSCLACPFDSCVKHDTQPVRLHKAHRPRQKKEEPVTVQAIRREAREDPAPTYDSLQGDMRALQRRLEHAESRRPDETAMAWARELWPDLPALFEFLNYERAHCGPEYPERGPAIARLIEHLRAMVTLVATSGHDRL